MGAARPCSEGVIVVSSALVASDAKALGAIDGGRLESKAKSLATFVGVGPSDVAAKTALLLLGAADGAIVIGVAEAIEGSTVSVGASVEVAVVGDSVDGAQDASDVAKIPRTLGAVLGIRVVSSSVGPFVGSAIVGSCNGNRVGSNVGDSDGRELGVGVDGDGDPEGRCEGLRDEREKESPAEGFELVGPAVGCAVELQMQRKN